MVYTISSLRQFLHRKKDIEAIIDGIQDGEKLIKIHNDLSLLNAKNTIDTQGQDSDLTAVVNFIGHAVSFWNHSPSSEWKTQLRAALMVLNSISLIESVQAPSELLVD